MSEKLYRVLLLAAVCMAGRAAGQTTQEASCEFTVLDADEAAADSLRLRLWGAWNTEYRVLRDPETADWYTLRPTVDGTFSFTLPLSQQYRTIYGSIERTGPSGRVRYLTAQLKPETDGTYRGEARFGVEGPPERSLWIPVEPLEGPVDEASFMCVGRYGQGEQPVYAKDGRVAIDPAFGRSGGGRRPAVPFMLKAGRVGEMQFSEDIVWPPDGETPEGEAYTRTREMPAFLQAGVSIEGRLDDSVPRPVRGFVQVNAFRMLDGSRSTQLTRDCDVRLDGTFTIPDIPQQAHLELHAFAWTGEPPEDPGTARPEPATSVCATFTVAERDAIGRSLGFDVEAKGQRPGFEIPSTYVIAFEEAVDGFVLPMQEPATAQVTVTDRAGQPVVGAAIVVQLMQGGVATEYSSRGTSFDRAGTELSGTVGFGITDFEGRAIVGGLPPAFVHQVMVVPADVRFADLSQSINFRRDTLLKSGETAEVAVQLE